MYMLLIPLEKENLLVDGIQEIIVYGKIPKAALLYQQLQVNHTAQILCMS